MSEYQISSEKQLERTYQEKIKPLMRSLTKGDFMGHSGVNISYAYLCHPHAIGAVAISTGRIESWVKYQEVMFDLYQNGYSVFIHDHRGQGLSGRMTRNPHMGFVDDFTDYVADFKLFYQKIIEPNTQHRPQLLCHSMGCAIGALYVLAHPQDFAQLIVCAPMFGIRPALPNWLASILIGANLLISRGLGHDASYFLGQKNYQETEFALNELTHSEIRYRLFRDEYNLQPEVQLGGVTGHWLRAALKAMDAIEAQASQISIPVWAIQAEADTVVDNKRQSRVLAKLPHCEVQQIFGARHEMLLEEDQYRRPCLAAILAFLRLANDR
ncbi:alpha/beta fold hydrolase [Paraglaciecola sp. T6c]|uniref:alpha/beta fold hydrolase n=1 Tax=Pseudoalteromonas atlantica (strain T6c / ATCC BAA-1087) TaxID=3042615 RepID=UPI0005A0C540|nr:alpha/beta fold hydrolase [Paraglaciecola sp. T6c]